MEITTNQHNGQTVKLEPCLDDESRYVWMIADYGPAMIYGVPATVDFIRRYTCNTGSLFHHANELADALADDDRALMAELLNEGEELLTSHFRQLNLRRMGEKSDGISVQTYNDCAWLIWEADE